MSAETSGWGWGLAFEVVELQIWIHQIEPMFLALKNKINIPLAFSSWTTGYLYEGVVEVHLI